MTSGLVDCDASAGMEVKLGEWAPSFEDLNRFAVLHPCRNASKIVLKVLLVEDLLESGRGVAADRQRFCGSFKY